MKLYIKQKVFSIGAKFDITDEQGNQQYFCKGKAISFGKKFKIFDNNNQIVVDIKQKHFKLMPTYKITASGKTITMKKKFTLARAAFVFQGVNWSVQGDFMAHNYKILSDGGFPVITINKKYMSFGDSYEMDISDGQDVLLALGTAIVIDAVCHPHH